MLHVCNDMMLLEISYNTKFPSLLTICFSECFVFNQWWILWQIIIRHFSCIFFFKSRAFLEAYWMHYLVFILFMFSGQMMRILNLFWSNLDATKFELFKTDAHQTLNSFEFYFCSIFLQCLLSMYMYIYTSWLKYNSWDLFLWSCLSCLSGILAVHCFWVNLMSHLTWGSVNDATCISEIFEFAWWYHIWLWISTYVFYVLFFSKNVNVSLQYGVLELWILEFEKFQMQCLHYILYLDFCKHDELVAYNIRIDEAESFV